MGKITIEEKWHQQSEAARIEAERLPYGKDFPTVRSAKPS
jgi:hypothetical protein